MSHPNIVGDCCLVCNKRERIWEEPGEDLVVSLRPSSLLCGTEVNIFVGDWTKLSEQRYNDVTKGLGPKVIRV